MPRPNSFRRLLARASWRGRVLVGISVSTDSVDLAFALAKACCSVRYFCWASVMIEFIWMRDCSATNTFSFASVIRSIWVYIYRAWDSSRLCSATSPAITRFVLRGHWLTANSRAYLSTSGLERVGVTKLRRFPVRYWCCADVSACVSSSSWARQSSCFLRESYSKSGIVASTSRVNEVLWEGVTKEFGAERSSDGG